MKEGFVFLAVLCCLDGGLTHSDTIEVKITVDSSMAVYVDGTFLVYDKKWKTQRTIFLPHYASVVAIYAQGKTDVQGIIASFDTGVISDRSWRCLAIVRDPEWYHPRWNLAAFTDTNWPAAEEVADYGASPWNTAGSEGISTDAKWIWGIGSGNDVTPAAATDRRAICRVSPSRCLVSDLPHEFAFLEQYGWSSEAGSSSSELPVLPDGEQYVRWGDIFISYCLLGSEFKARCEKDGTWKLTKKKCKVPKRVKVQSSYGCQEATCTCSSTSCYEQKAENCRCKNCKAGFCCCRTQATVCHSDEHCGCHPGPRSCRQRGLEYCPHEGCDQCRPEHCCCPYLGIPDLEPDWEVTESYGCLDPAMCRCCDVVCYSQRLESCDCATCPSGYCCCATLIRTCDGRGTGPDGGCECQQGAGSCHQRGLATCPPGKCGAACEPQKCCCKDTGLTCSLEVQLKCLEECTQQRMMPEPGSECTDCRCQDVCAEKDCPSSTVCRPEKLMVPACMIEPCPIIGLCVLSLV